MLVCKTLAGMAPSISGAEVIFSVSLNNRDFAVATDFSVFTFYPEAISDRLLPESGPLRGGTGVTVVGSNFFTLCRTAHDAITGRCYSCDDQSQDTFLWGPKSSCTVTVPGSQNRGVVPWPSSRPCGLPCRPGMDDRDSFGVTGVIYCSFGNMKLPARYMTPNRVKCFSPRTPSPSVATRLLTRVTLNDQQYTPEDNLFSYYTITGVSPSIAPTYGGTIVSVEGHNLFTGSRNGLEIQCLFWLDIYTIGGYDEKSDRVLCQVPEQPAEMRDNVQDEIDFAISLNRNIKDQYTDERQVVQYLKDDLPKSMYPYKGPMNGGSQIYFELPYRLLPEKDWIHVMYPYNYQHSFSQRYRNDTALLDRRTVCFGTLQIVKEKVTLLPYTCCDNIKTETPCDGAVVVARFDNSSFLSVTLPPYPTPQSVNVDVSINGIRNGEFNPTAQYSMQASCDFKLNKCMQAQRDGPCIDHIDCGGLIFRYWGITDVFPVAFDVQAAVTIRLIGNNFPHSEDEEGTCIFFQASDNTEYARRSTTVNEVDCEECPARDENDNCVIERYCKAVSCLVPPAPSLTPIEAYVEAQFGAYPITSQRQRIQYYKSASVSRLVISAGPEHGGTTVIVRGLNFVNTSRLFCQFAAVPEFSLSHAFSQAQFINDTALRCISPMCKRGFTGNTAAGACDECKSCNTPVKITMNFRDFLPGYVEFGYRRQPELRNVTPIRAPSRMVPRTGVTVTGAKFSNIGTRNDVGYGLSCKFGHSIVGAVFHSSCTAFDERASCNTVTCIPPENGVSEEVAVFVSVDTQQWQGIYNKDYTWRNLFAYYTITDIHPPYVLTTGGGVIATSGVNVDQGRAYACRFFNSTIAKYLPAISMDKHTVGCKVPPFTAGFYNVSVSLDGTDVALENRDFTGAVLEFETYTPAYVDDIKPTKGEAVGGIAVTLRGRNFWNSPLLVCAFGGALSVRAQFVDTTTVVCTSPAQFGPVHLEVSLNGQEFSNDTRTFVNYFVPVVSRLVPERIPAEVSRHITVRGVYFEDFAEAACIFEVASSGSDREYVKAFFINSTAYRCQAPVGLEGTVSNVKLTLDRKEISKNSAKLHYYDVTSAEPFVGPIFGRTHVSIDGFFLNEGEMPKCQFVSQAGLDIHGSRKETIYFVEVLSGGSNYSDGQFALGIGACTDSGDIVYGIDVENIASGYQDGVFTVDVQCAYPCNGTGLSATYTVEGEVVTKVTILHPGQGYNMSHPPVLKVRGCDGVGGTGTCTPVRFKVRAGNNCNILGCCRGNNTFSGVYSVLKGKVQSVTVTDGGSGFNHNFPPGLALQGCNGSVSSEGTGCQKCTNGVYTPSGTCTSGAACSCSGSQVYCTDLTAGSAVCRCSAPNTDTECTSHADCTGGGTCEHSAHLRLLVANVTVMPGRRGAQNEPVCIIPPVTFPSSVGGFFQYQSISKQYYGMARMFIKISIHTGPEFTAKSLIYHFYDPPSVSSVYPNSAANRGGSRITVTGALFKRETDLTTIRLSDDFETSLRNMEVTCRLHHSLKSQPATFVNSTHVYCRTNRVCFDGSTMSGCQECILEGCDQPVLDYSHNLPTNTFFSPQVALNDQDFANDRVPMYVYSISSFRPFGGVYNGGTHVSIAGISFDRGGFGPYDAHCRFARIVVPARYEPVQQLIKCLSQPLLDIYTVLEVHLGSNLSDTTLWTENRQIFNMYTAYPPGLQISPDTGSFTGKQPIRFEVPRAHQFNHFRFRPFDFNTDLEGVEASMLVQGQRDDDPRNEPLFLTLSRIISMEVNLHICLENRACIGDPKCIQWCKIRTQHCIWERICHNWLGYSNDCQCRFPDMLFETYVEDTDVSFGHRKRIDDKNFEVEFRIEPTDQPLKIKAALSHVFRTDTVNTMLHSDWVDKAIAILNHPSFEHLNVTPRVLPQTFGFYSEYGAYARFGPLITSGWVSELEAMEAQIAPSPVDSPATVQVSFCMNGQQFSLQPVSFYYYTVSKVVPFGVPVNYPSMGGTEVDSKVWLACPDVSEYCMSTAVKNYGQPLATIRIYGNNFRKDAQPVRGAIYDKPHCRYGRLEDDIPVQLCAFVRVHTFTLSTYSRAYMPYILHLFMFVAKHQ